MEPAKSDEERQVLKCLEREEVVARALADAKAETGEALMRLEAAKRKEGVNRSVWVARLMDLCGTAGYEPMTTAAIAARKRIASWRHRVTPELARRCMGLGITQQKMLAGLSAGRLEEFLHQGVPVLDHGRKALSEAKGWEVRRAVQYAKEFKEGDEIWIQPKREDAWHPTPTLMDKAAKALRRLVHLTPEQAAGLLEIFVILLAKGPQRTTRRLAVPPVPGAVPEPGPSARERALVLMAAVGEIRQRCREIEFTAAWEGGAMRARAVSEAAQLLAAVCRWDRPVERLTG